MDKWIKENRIIGGILFALLIFLAVYYNFQSHKEFLYKMDSDCAKSALSFAKEKNKGISTWEVVQSKFHEHKNSCFAEFSFGSYFEIYDLTHNKELALNPPLLGEVNENYTNHVEKYKETKNEIFGDR